MHVTVDDVWSSPSTLHVRVTVHDDQGRWRHRYYPAIPLDQVPVEAVAPFLAYYGRENIDERQLSLFDV